MFQFFSRVYKVVNLHKHLQSSYDYVRIYDKLSASLIRDNSELYFESIESTSITITPKQHIVYI